MWRWVFLKLRFLIALLYSEKGLVLKVGATNVFVIPRRLYNWIPKSRFSSVLRGIGLFHWIPERHPWSDQRLAAVEFWSRLVWSRTDRPIDYLEQNGFSYYNLVSSWWIRNPCKNISKLLSKSRLDYFTFSQASPFFSSRWPLQTIVTASLLSLSSRFTYHYVAFFPSTTSPFRAFPPRRLTIIY